MEDKEEGVAVGSHRLLPLLSFDSIKLEMSVKQAGKMSSEQLHRLVKLQAGVVLTGSFALGLSSDKLKVEDRRK